MVPTPSPEPNRISEAERQALLGLARSSILHGLREGRPLAVRVTDFPPALQALRASFVTLHCSNELRGCIGHLEAVQPLATDVVENAFSAAFRDPRFPPLAAAELPSLRIHLSVLTTPTPLAFASEQKLIAQLRPGHDGLILEEGRKRGTFLPSVWESLPQPREFLRHLKLKAGLGAGYWSQQVKGYRYEAESFGESA